MPDEIDLATRFLSLHRAELLEESLRGDVEITQRVGLRVRAAAARVREVPDLAFVAVIAERLDVDTNGRAVPCASRAVDSRDDHHAVPGTAGAVGGRCIGVAVGRDGVDETPAHVDDVDDDLTGRRARERACERVREPAQGVGRREEWAAQTPHEPVADARDGLEVAQPRVERLAHAVADPVGNCARVADEPADERHAVAASSVPVETVDRRQRARGQREPQRGSQLTALGRGRERLLVGLARRDEMHELGEIGRAERQHGIDVAVADPQTEVQHGAVVAIAAATRSTDDVAACDGLPGVHRDRREERVRTAQVAVVRDDDVQRARDIPGEADDTVVRGAHRRAGERGEVGAAMTGTERRRGRAEGLDDAAVDRTQPRGRRRVVDRVGGCRERGNREPVAEQDKENTTNLARGLCHRAPPWSEGNDTGKARGAPATVARGPPDPLGITGETLA